MIAGRLRDLTRWVLTRGATTAGPDWHRTDLLVVAPHPDDETLGCGALIEAAVAASATVTVVVCTDGAASHHGAPSTELAARRGRELRTAMATLGVPHEGIVELGLDDGRLTENMTELCERLSDVLAQRGPQRVLVTSHLEPHPDHAAAAAAVRRVSAGHEVWEYPIWLWADWPFSRRVAPATGAAQCWSLLRRRAMRRLAVPAGSAKPAAIACYASQLGGAAGDPALPESLVARARGGPELFFRA